ncbi:MAG: hypoxanthine phosphoribosyltransferase [Endomicrobium sp.]|jgi:hypoxanthine phosphoribosyltransferase|nr:hypoxanthine phosphoribosyltransferase [Endomicrobium sp.]
MVKILFSKDDIEKRVSEIAAQISRDFKGKDVVMVAVLRGSFVFFADLIRMLDFDFSVDFISLSSYIGTFSQGDVKKIYGLQENLSGKDVIIVEDIVDTGRTLDFLFKEFSFKNPRSLSACALLNKKCARIIDVPVKYFCFETGNDFVVGYGLDYNGLYRGLPYIAKFLGKK